MERVGVRRRLVQSTLLPRRENSDKVFEQCDGSQFEEELEEEALECGGRRKRRLAKSKSNSKRKSTTSDSLKQITKNGMDASSNQVDNGDPSVSLKFSSFVKASECKQRIKEQEQLADSPEKRNELCSASTLFVNGSSTPQKSKRQTNTTPNKERKNSTPSKKTKPGATQVCSSQIPCDVTPDEQKQKKVLDLRLEAKLTAEENSRIFAGRQIHPFFSSWKSGKRSQYLSDAENMMLLSEKEEKGIIFSPIHVFDSVQGDHMALDWERWEFLERSSSDGLECEISPVCEGSVVSLNFDNYLCASHFTQILSSQNSDQYSMHREICDENQKNADILRCTKEKMSGASIETAFLVHKPEQNDVFVVNSRCGNSDSELQERIVHLNHTCPNQSESCLWTDKYQPRDGNQICGNGESVKFLSEWLRLWQKKGSLTSTSCIDEDKYVGQDVDYDCQKSDSDSDTSECEDSLKNVLLLTGPVGSGKSAAIYACAREHGFHIIEINASDWRNGALIKQKFAEAVESRWLQRTTENSIISDKSPSKFSAGNSKAHCSENEVIDLKTLSDKEDSQNTSDWLSRKVSGENSTANCHNEIKSLILFEDVDVTLYEDHGFISTIRQLAETAKRPMILTSNSASPVLPKNLNRTKLSFDVPSVKDLLGLVSVICAAEKVDIHPCLMERFVDYCGGDIRKTIMLLQFWSPGQTPEKGNKSQMTYNPVLFDLDAGHHILPKMIPWGYPSQLSELVLKEVVKSLSFIEETLSKDGKLNVNIAEDIYMEDAEPDPFEVKKEEMLNLHSSLEDEIEFARFDVDSQSFDSCSPVAFTRQNSRRINTVVTSDSEDDFLVGSMPQVSDGLLDVDIEVLGMKCMSASHCLPTEPIFSSEVGSLEKNCFHHLQRVSYSHINNTCKSLDLSCNPESSFVPETELISEGNLYSTTVSYGHFPDAAEANFVVQDSLSIFEPSVTANLNKSCLMMPNSQETFGFNSDIGTSFIYEEVGESLSKCVADVRVDYQVLDECSCVDFVSRLKSLGKPVADQVYDSVQESWNRMHDQCNDLRIYATAEEKIICQVLKLVHETSNLVSVADLLLKDCQTVLLDSLEPSMNSCESTHSYNYHDDQLEMSSVLSQHGMCFYAKKLASFGSTAGSSISLDLASEMLSSSVSSIALGKLASQDQRKAEISVIKASKSSNLLTCTKDARVGNILQSLAPSRSYLALKGEAFHEYLSTLSQISRFESTRLSQSIGQKQRRTRVARHYLSSSSLAMSSEDISLLGRYNSYQNDPSLLGDERFRTP